MQGLHIENLKASLKVLAACAQQAAMAHAVGAWAGLALGLNQASGLGFLLLAGQHMATHGHRGRVGSH